ncbi:hypothetical protein, partial [Burkholderia cenocepacia]
GHQLGLHDQSVSSSPGGGRRRVARRRAESDRVRSGLKHPDETVDHFLENLEIYFYVISPRELDFQKV